MADDFGDLRDDRVAEGFTCTSTYPSGNPIMHSRRRIPLPATVLKPSPLSGELPRLFQSPFTRGVGNRTERSKISKLGLTRPRLPPQPPRFVEKLDTTGVGSNQEHSFAEMGSPEGSSADNLPLRIEPEGGKVDQQISQSGRPQSLHVFDDSEGGSKLGKNSCKLWPEPAFVLLRFARTGNGDWLAGESSADEIDSRESCSSNKSDIFKPLGRRPVAFKDSSAIGIFFDLPDGVAQSGQLEAALEATDPREQRTYSQGCSKHRGSNGLRHKLYVHFSAWKRKKKSYTHLAAHRFCHFAAFPADLSPPQSPSYLACE